MRKLLYLFGLSLFFTSCGWLNPSIMLKTDKDYKYSQNPDSSKALDYKISSNDILEFSMYSNDGFKLVDLTSLNSANMGYRFESNIQYLVESDGNAKLPVLGRIRLSGYTIREAESLLEEKYASFYVRPYVIMSVSNKRVIVFPGSAGDAKVIPLINNNTTLIEALALAGGIADDGKAKMVKLIRQGPDKKHDRDLSRDRFGTHRSYLTRPRRRKPIAPILRAQEYHRPSDFRSRRETGLPQQAGHVRR